MLPPSHRSCYDIATLVFATLKLIILAAGVVGSIAGILFSNSPYQTWRSILSTQICGFLLVFTAFLFHGVVKKRPEHIKVYLVFGVVLLFLTNFGIVVFATFLDGPYNPFRLIYWDPAILALVVIGQVVYGLVLTMIYNTYSKIKAIDKVLDEQKQLLVEKIMDEKFSVPVYTV